MSLSWEQHPTGEATRGLRARKRERTRKGIVANAIRLFRRSGVRSASLGDVARSSQISQATLFNYFPNKGTLAEAWVRGEIAEALEQVTRDLGDAGLRPVLRGLCRRVAATPADEYAVRLEAWRETGRASSGTLEPTHPIVRAIAREQERERVRGDLSAHTLAEMLVDATEGGLIEGLRAGADEKARAKFVQARVDLILDGARKRNERVVATNVGRKGR